MCIRAQYTYAACPARVIDETKAKIVHNLFIEHGNEELGFIFCGGMSAHVHVCVCARVANALATKAARIECVQMSVT